MTSTRKYELDWLRVALIFLVFLHHVCMPFNGDSWHIMNKETSKTLDDFMYFLELWRLPFLFFISGVGCILATRNRSVSSFLKERHLKLLVPMIFGAFFIVPPQVYFQYIEKFSSYFDLYPEMFFKFELNHLWFLKHLFVYSLIASMFIFCLKRNYFKTILIRLIQLVNKPYGLISLSLFLIISQLILKPYFPSGSSDLFNLSKTAYYFFFFFMGMILSSSEHIWSTISTYKSFNLIVFICSKLLFLFLFYLPWKDVYHIISKDVLLFIWNVNVLIVSWSFIITIIGYSSSLLNKNHRWLPKLNEAIYPFYILHQTVIVICAFYTVNLDLSIVQKISLILTSSLSITLIIYVCFIYPFSFIRPFFGMKKK
jgi:glucan biosynthesis protein C